jgi:hypothetical protein
LNAQEIGWAAVIVDAKNEPTAAFYESYGFHRFSPESQRLFTPRTGDDVSHLKCLSPKSLSLH